MATTLTPLAVNAVKTNTSAPAMGYINRYDATAGGLTVTLPALSGLNVGSRTMVQKHTLDVSTNTVTFNRAGSDQFDDASTSAVLTRSGESRTLQVVLISGVKRWKVTESMSTASSGGGGAAVSEFIVSTYYGGTFGAGDDQICIQNTINAARDAGGGTVVIPPPPVGASRLKFSQLIVPPAVHLRGPGWHSFAAENTRGRTTLQQLSGVNDDAIVFALNTSHYMGPLGISNLSLQAAAGSTAGHAINVQLQDATEVSVQDMTTFERIYAVGFAGSAIRIPGGVPIVLSDIAGLGNGRYTVEIVDTDSVHDVLLRNISGDANMGGVSDAGGAVVLLKDIVTQANKQPSVSIFGIKGEYRIRESWANGDDTSMGCLNALVIENCTCPITVTGVQHLSSATQTRRPGNAIQIKGAGRPNLMWQGVSVRGNFPGQTGTVPNLVYDEVLTRGSDSPHGVWGPTPFITDDVSAKTLKDSSGNNILGLTATGSANYLALKNAAAGGYPALNVTGSDTNVGLYFTPKGSGYMGIYATTGQTPRIRADGDDTDVGLNLQTKGAGVVQANGVEVATLTGTQTLTGKTLTAPKIANNGFIADANGNEALTVAATASAVNGIKITTAATGGQPTITGIGDDASVDLNLASQGGGSVRINGQVAVSSGNTVTLSNKRITKRIGTTASSATPSINTDSVDQYNITALAAAITSVTVSGTPTDGQELDVRVKDDGTARAIAWGSSFTGTLLSTTAGGGKTHLQRLKYDAAAAKWAGYLADATGY